MIGGVFLSIWYSMMLKPISTISLLLVLASIVWGAQAIIKSFKRPKVSVTKPTPSVDEGITIFPTLSMTPQALTQFASTNQLGFAANNHSNHLQAQAMQTGQTIQPMQSMQPFVQVMPQLPTHTSQHTNQAGFYNPLHMQHYQQRSNG